MRKEIIFAILAGGTLGLIIAFGVWRANVALSNRTNGNSTTSQSPSPKPEFGITLASLEDNSVVTESIIKVSGITKANSFVAISGEGDDYLLKTDTNGAFEEEVELVPGVNQLVLFAFAENGESASIKLTLVYSSEFAKLFTPAPESTSQATSTSSIRDKVQQKVEEALKKPRAYIGTVTDISESTIQIKTDSGEIKQASVSSDTTFVKSDKTTKEVKFSDVAIGDFIVAMGLKNGNEVLEAKRILITSPISPTTRKAYIGTIKALDKKSLTISVLKGQDTPFTLPTAPIVLSFEEGKISKIKYANLSEGDLLIVFGQDKQNTSEARTIFLIK